MENWIGYLRRAVAEQASDIFVVVGMPLSFKRDGIIRPAGGTCLSAADSEDFLIWLYQQAGRDMARLRATGDDDFSLSVSGLSRFRISAYRQRGSLAAVIRVVAFAVPSAESLHIPESVLALRALKHGMVLVSGPAGSGKSTTLACLIDAINRTRNCHIITMEDPIEYLHRNIEAVVSQREIAMDTESCLTALRACLRQAPDVILVGEMRDYETIRMAMTAAETGHLLISTLHTVGAVNTIDRIIDVFPPNQQAQIRVQLSMVLSAVVSQQLLPACGGGLIPAFEIMHVNSAIRNMIREGKTYQINNVIQTSAAEGMAALDASLLSLCRRGQISAEDALRHAANPEQLSRRLAAL